jgi:hypothetical protein
MPRGTAAKKLDARCIIRRRGSPARQHTPRKQLREPRLALWAS